MTILLGIVQFVIISVVTVLEYVKKSPVVFLWATLLLMFGIPHLFTSFISYNTFPDWVYQKASLFVSLFTIFYGLTRIGSHKKYKLIFLPVHKRFLLVLFILLFITVFLKIYNIYISTGSLLDSSWGSSRELNQVSYFSYQRFLNAIYYPVSACLLIGMLDRRLTIKYISFILLLATVIISRNRIEVLPILTSFIGFIFIRNIKVNFKVVTLMLLFGFLSLYIVYGLLIFRYYGSLENFIINFDFIEFNEMIMEQLTSGEGEIGFREVFYYFISEDNNFKYFGEGHTYLRIMLVLVPTEWSLGLKPSDFAIAMGQAWLPGSEGYSMHPTLFGDSYANFGFLGVLLGFFWGVFANVSDKIIYCINNDIKIPFFIAFSCCFVIIGRGSVYNGFIWLFFGLIFIYLLRKIINKLL